MSKPPVRCRHCDSTIIVVTLKASRRGGRDAHYCEKHYPRQISLYAWNTRAR